MTNDRPDIQIVSSYKILDHGTTQLRCVQPAQSLKNLGYTVSLHKLDEARPIARQLIILHRVALNSYARHFITCAKARGIALVYDTDDLIFDADGFAYLSQSAKAGYYQAGWTSYAEAMTQCDAVTVSTEFLGTRARHVHSNTHVVLNALNDTYLRAADGVAEHRRQTPRDKITMAYLSGSNSHDKDFATLETALLRVLRKYPHTQLLLVGPLAIPDTFSEFGNRIIRQNFVPYENFPHIFEKVDINLIPLETDQAFCHAKSELKFIEAAACGVVSAASPTEPHKAAIDHGQNGVLATADWDCLDQLIEDKEMRMRLGDKARQTVLAHYTLKKREPVWRHILSSVIQQEKTKTVGHGAHLKSSAILALFQGQQRMRRWALKTRRSLLNKS